MDQPQKEFHKSNNSNPKQPFRTSATFTLQQYSQIVLQGYKQTKNEL